MLIMRNVCTVKNNFANYSHKVFEDQNGNCINTVLIFQNKMLIFLTTDFNVTHVMEYIMDMIHADYWYQSQCSQRSEQIAL